MLAIVLFKILNHCLGMILVRNLTLDVRYDLMTDFTQGFTYVVTLYYASDCLLDCVCRIFGRVFVVGFTLYLISDFTYCFITDFSYEFNLRCY